MTTQSTKRGEYNISTLVRTRFVLECGDASVREDILFCDGVNQTSNFMEIEAVICIA